VSNSSCWCACQLASCKTVRKHSPYAKQVAFERHLALERGKRQAERGTACCSHQPPKDEDLVSAAGSCMTHTRRGCRPPSDDGGYPLHAVSVQDGDILYQLTCSLSTALHLILFGQDWSEVQIVPGAVPHALHLWYSFAYPLTMLQ